MDNQSMNILPPGNHHSGEMESEFRHSEIAIIWLGCIHICWRFIVNGLPPVRYKVPLIIDLQQIQSDQPNQALRNK